MLLGILYLIAVINIHWPTVEQVHRSTRLVKNEYSSFIQIFLTAVNSASNVLLNYRACVAVSRKNFKDFSRDLRNFSKHDLSSSLFTRSTSNPTTFPSNTSSTTNTPFLNKKPSPPYKTSQDQTPFFKPRINCPTCVARQLRNTRN